MRKVCILLLILSLLCAPCASLAATLTADPAAATAEMSDTLYGLFFEDINHAADGGLYAELLQNRSFENQDLLDPKPHQHYNGWQFNLKNKGKAAAVPTGDDPLHANNPTYMRITVEAAPYLLSNMGYASTAFSGGVPVDAGAQYDFSVWMRNTGDYTGGITVAITDRSANPLSEAFAITPTGSWQKFEHTFTSQATADACLTITLEGTGTLDIDMASLMPRERFGAEWPGGGLRTDLVETLMALNPSFLRFPGGCVAEGSYVWANAYNWKDTVGPVEQRRENFNTWGYMQSYGIGFFEYFCLAEALGAEPLPVVHSGLLCQAREVREAPLTMEATRAYGQDILDLIEFATGDASTPWGSLRAEMGHPEPFRLNYLAIGNENWDNIYFDRYAVLSQMVKEKYPEITCIVAAGPVAEGALPQHSWHQIRTRFAEDLVDEHYYMDSAWFLKNVGRYDRYPRTTMVFLGEYAAHEPVQGGRRPNNLYSALCEAAYMTGIERNSDLVRMACYAPLLARDGMFQWTPDLIWFNARDVLLTPNYYVQQMFAATVGDHVVESALEGEGLYHVVTRTEDALYVKVVSLAETETPLTLTLPGVPDGTAGFVQLCGERRMTNAFTAPDRIVPADGVCPILGGVAETVLPAYSVTIFTFPLAQ
ncbi:MAG: alpha-N-arabinofuranosidase [Clostridiales bacterium]|nr:alpha-N-arabinofuranosidase [Clostridiales bacterium]